MRAQIVEFRFESGALSAEAIHRIATDLWADLAFDEEALVRLKRDGLMLDGIRLGGPSPYRIQAVSDGEMLVAVEDSENAERLLDLWRIHVMKGLRGHRLAA